MRQRSEPFHLFLSRCLYVYAVLATVYTLCYFFIFVLRYQFLPRNRRLRPPPTRMTFPLNMTAQQAEEFLWSNFSLSSHHSFAARDPILSRAFPRLMRPSRIIPYYYHATGNFENDDITVTTLISSDRFPVFRHLVRRYKGMTFPPSSPSALPRRLLRPDLCYNPRVFALSGYPNRSPYYVYIFTGLLNLRRRPSRPFPIPNV